MRMGGLSHLREPPHPHDAHSVITDSVAVTSAVERERTNGAPEGEGRR